MALNLVRMFWMEMGKVDNSVCLSWAIAMIANRWGLVLVSCKNLGLEMVSNKVLRLLCWLTVVGWLTICRGIGSKGIVVRVYDVLGSKTTFFPFQ